MTQGPDSDAVRLRIVAPEANVIPQLIHFVSSEGTQSIIFFLQSRPPDLKITYANGDCECLSKTAASVRRCPEPCSWGACPGQLDSVQVWELRGLLQGAQGWRLWILCSAANSGATCLLLLQLFKIHNVLSTTIRYPTASNMATEC